MIKKSLVSICLLLSLISFAQEGSSSPYSFYGLGDMRFKGTVENRSMGGLSVFPDSIHMNLQNPAFYPDLKRINFTLGATYATTKLKTNTQEENARRTTLDYLAIGIPMGKFGGGFGLMPYTSVGYKIQTFPNADTPEGKKYTGTGGLNKAFIGGGYQITKSLSLGAEFGYYFGNIETNSIYFIEGVQYGTRELNQSAVGGGGFTAGISYKSKINKKLQVAASATFSPEASLKFANERNIATVQFYTSGQIGVIDDEDIVVADTKIKMPSKLSFGGGIGEPTKWMVGTELTLQQSSDLGNRFNDINDVAFENAYKWSLGGYYVPNYNSFASYWKRITYRGGFKYEKTGLVINDKSIDDAGMTLGLSLPVSGNFSNINLGFEFGKRGTKDAGLVEENYMNFTIGLSLNDRWFVKKKYE
ncbi:MAG TPA: hypothetical protein VK623_00035 [Flavobacterium sp.]|nr:hypothetical protein [Flavobacterium sp.]